MSKDTVQSANVYTSFTLTNVEFRKSRDFFAWILRESSVSFAKFCEFLFVERGKQA